MPRPRKSVPSYLRHPSGKARAVWTDPTGTRRYKLLPGLFNSPESLEAFARLQLELATSPSAPSPSALHGGPTVVEVLLPYLKFVGEYHGDTSEAKTIKHAIRMARELYGRTPASQFGPIALKAIREAMILKGWSRQYCNRQVGRIIRAFKWAVSAELIPATVYQALRTLDPLRQGKTDARESKARRPADPTTVAATLPHLPPHARALVELLRLTGMRPSEACRMSLGQIDRAGAVWVYTPTRHKTAHKGKGRAILLGERSQAVIVAHLGGKVLGPDEPLFSPRRQKAEIAEARRAKRKTPMYPSHAHRLKKLAANRGTERLPGEWFTPEALGHAVVRACRAADADAKADARASGVDETTAGVPAWSPYQLRHLVGAELREQFSLEHVRAALGHSHASMSAHYAKGADAKLAAEVASKVG